MGKHAYGHGTYFKMMEIALEHDIPVDMVAATIIRSVLSEFYGFKCGCPIEKIDVRRDGRRPHCKWCWNFIEILQKSKHFEDAMGRTQETRPVKYRPLRNKFEEELRRKLRHELEQKEDPLSSIKPDQTGGRMKLKDDPSCRLCQHEKRELDNAKRYLHYMKVIDELESEILQESPNLDRINRLLYGNWKVNK